MTRLYRLNPIAAGSRGRNIGITLPPVANWHAETDYSTSTGGLTWGYLDAVVDNITEAANYDGDTFSVAPTDWPVIWEWTAGDSDLLCQIINTSGFPINNSVLDFTITISGTGSTMSQTVTSSAGNDTLFGFVVASGRTVTMTLDKVLVNPVSFKIRTATIPAE